MDDNLNNYNNDDVQNKQEQGVSQTPQPPQAPRQHTYTPQQTPNQQAPQSQQMPPQYASPSPQTSHNYASPQQYQGQQAQFRQQYHGQQNYQNQAPYPQQIPAQVVAQQPPRRLFRNVVKTILATVSLVRGLLVVILLLLLIGLVGSIFTTPIHDNNPTEDSFSVIRIVGTITDRGAFGDAGYDHRATVEYIRNLANNPYDRGILLYMNTPGGTIYHSDELYLALLEYKTLTGRPVHVYMSEMSASGGFYIAMAADHVSANRITITGSLGVVSTMMDTSGLFEYIGIRTVIIDSGEHKSTGAMGTVITAEQEAVMQSIIDEYYDIFVDIIATGRDMDVQAVRNLADGRIFTARQALEHGLIDEISTWEAVLSEFEALTGVPAHYPSLIIEAGFMGQVFSRISGIFPRSDTSIAESIIDELPRGVPLAIAMELVN